MSGNFFKKPFDHYTRACPSWISTVLHSPPKRSVYWSFFALFVIPSFQLSFLWTSEQPRSCCVALLKFYLPDAKARPFVGISQNAKRRAVLGDLTNASKQAGLMDDFPKRQLQDCCRNKCLRGRHGHRYVQYRHLFR